MNKFGEKKSLLLYFVLFISMIGVVWSWLKYDDRSGFIYFIIMCATVVLSVVLYFFTKNDSSFDNLGKYIKNPLSTDLGPSAIMYLIGFLVPIVVALIAGNLFVQYSIPLSAPGTEGAVLSFESALIAESSAWTMFNVMWLAGSIETWAFNFIIPVLGVFIGVFIVRLIKRDASETSTKAWSMIIGMSISVLFFVVMHQLNATYSGTDYIFAAMFLLVANLSIYYGGVFLMFWVGYHMSNNLVYLATLPSFNLGAALFSPFGLLLIAFIGLLVYYVGTNWNKGETIKNKSLIR